MRSRWTGAARAVWVVDREDDSDIRKMTPAKVQHGIDNTGYDFTLQSTKAEGIETAEVVWGKTTFEQNANQMLQEKADYGGYAFKEARRIIGELMQSHGWRVASELGNKVANDNQISRSTLKRVKRDLGIEGETLDNGLTWYWQSKKKAA